MRVSRAEASLKAPFIRKALTACAAATLTLGLGLSTASALPPGGAKSSTPGTSSTVSSSVTENGMISFTLSGFPANTQVSVKIDDGDLCPSNAAQGACVVHQQKSDSNGNISGSFILPDVGVGTHTLRFLATGEKRDKNGNYLGTEAYTNRSPEFSVVAKGGSESNSSNSSGSASSSSRRSGSNTSQNNGSNAQNESNSDSSDPTTENNSQNLGSSDAGTSASSAENAQAETVYTDAEGNVITKEEYDRLNAKSDSAGTDNSKPEAKTEEKSEEKGEAVTASASASSTARGRGQASAPSASASASSATNAAATVQTVTYGAAFPWAGVIVLSLSLIAAAAVTFVRKR